MKKCTVKFDEASHTYCDSEGSLTAVGKPISLLSDYSSVPADVLKQAQLRGREVHLLSERHDQGIAKILPQHRQYVGYLEGYKKFRKENPWEVVAMEELVYCLEPRYAGRLDRVFKRKQGRPIIDVKSSARASHTWDIQLAVYKRAWNILHPKQLVDDRIVVQLNKHGFYNLVEEKDMIPYEDCLTIFDQLLVIYGQREIHDSAIAKIKEGYKL
jgi:hypothetical protein